MIIFWSLCAAMLVLALGFVVLPLMKNRQPEDSNREDLNISIHREHLRELERELEEGLIEQQQFDKSVEELELDLLSDMQGEKEKTTIVSSRSPLIAGLISVAIPLLTILLYVSLGEPGLIDGQPQQEVLEGASSEQMHSIEEMVVGLEGRLKEQPDDGEGWNMLGRSYLVLKRYSDAARAYKKTRELLGDNPALLADTAEALIMANNNQFSEESVNLLNQTLQLDPNNKKALWMAGYFGLEQGQIQTALQLWQRLLGLFPDGSQEAIALKQHIADVIQQSGITEASESLAVAESGSAATQTGSNTPAAAGGASIDVYVSLDPAVAASASPDDIVFIYARAAEGPRMPLAISRNRVRDLPIKVTLNDSMAMSPAMSLSKFNQIIVGARVSKSGNAMPGSGDINGSSGVITLTEVLGVKVTIDEIIP